MALEGVRRELSGSNSYRRPTSDRRARAGWFLCVACHMAGVGLLVLCASPCYCEALSAGAKPPPTRFAISPLLGHPRQYGIMEIADARRVSELQARTLVSSRSNASAPKHKSVGVFNVLRNVNTVLTLIALSFGAWGLIIPFILLYFTGRWQQRTTDQIVRITEDNDLVIGEMNAHSETTDGNHGKVMWVLEWLVLNN